MVVHWRRKRDAIFQMVTDRSLLPPLPNVTGLVGAFFGRVFSRMTKPLDKMVLLAVVIFIMMIPLATIALLQLVAMAMLFVLLLPTLPWLWRVPTVLISAATMGRELETQRWQTLRVTPYSTRDMVLALLSAGTHRVYLLWMFTTIARMVLALLLTLSLHWETQIGNLVGRSFGAFDWVVWGLSLCYLIVEPLIDVAADGAVGIIGATFGRTQFRAIVQAVILRLALWLVQLLSLLIIIPVVGYVFSQAQAQVMPTLVLMGPTYAMLFRFSAQTTLVLIVGFLVLRLLTLHVLVKIAVWRSEQVVV
jgi:hypothetical protein